MAKKQTAKTSKKTAKIKSAPARAGAAKAARKPAKATKPVKSAPKAASAKMPEGIVPVSTGKGPSAAEVGGDFVALFNARTPDQEIWNKLFAKEFTSVEGHGANVAFHGRDAVTAKCDEWLAANTIHGCSCEGPYAGSTCFAVKFRIDKTDNSTGRREVMEEVAIYTVQDGKVVREEFCYAS